VRVTRHRFLRFALGSAVAGATLGLAGWRVGHWALRVENHVFRLESLPAGFDGFRILLLSDVHAGANMDDHRMSEVVQFVNSLEADLIVIGGDMIDGGASATDARSFARIFRDLKSAHGVVAVPGNHDHASGIETLVKELHGSSIVLLRNEHHVIESSDGGLAFLGVDDPRVHTFDPPQDEAVAAVASRAPGGLLPILLAHRPAAFEAARRHGIPLTLAGHTHGGQIALPWRDLTPVRLVTKYVRGHYQLGNSHLVVSSGVGTSGPPIRVGVPPSLALVTLHSGLGDPA
jgi:predicted MPP superfamily phosphohydrolase